MASDDRPLVPLQPARPRSTPRLVSALTEKTRKVALDDALLRLAREASDSVTRRVRPAARRDPEWSPAQDLGFDERGSAEAAPLGEDTVATSYKELIAATDGTAEITVQVDLPPDEQTEPMLGSWRPATSGDPREGLLAWLPWVPVAPPDPAAEVTSEGGSTEHRPAPLPPAPLPPAPVPRIQVIDRPPPFAVEVLARRSAGPPPRIVTPIFPPREELRSQPQPRPLTLKGVGDTGPQPLHAAPVEPLAREGAFPARSDRDWMTVEVPALVFASRTPGSSLWRPVLLGSGAALLALGLGMLVLLTGNPRTPAFHPPPIEAPPLEPAAPVAAAPEPSAKDLLARASALEQRRDYRAAYRLYSEAQQRAPASPEALHGQARVGVELGLPEPLEVLSRSGRSEDRRAVALLRVRQAMLAGQWRQAEARLRALPAGDRDQVIARIWRAECEILAARGESGRATDSYRALLRDPRLGPGPLLAEAALGYARLLLDLGLNEVAVRHAESAARAAAGVPSLQAEAHELIARFKQ